MEEHLYVNGFDKGYTKWVLHKKSFEDHVNRDVALHEHEAMDSHEEVDEDTEKILDDVEADINRKYWRRGCTSHFVKLCEDAQCELYPRCKKFLKLGFVIRMLHIK